MTRRGQGSDSLAAHGSEWFDTQGKPHADSEVHPGSLPGTSTGRRLRTRKAGFFLVCKRRVSDLPSPYGERDIMADYESAGACSSQAGGTT